MKICSFASGSGGNCTFLEAGGTHILIDVGISLRRIRGALASLGLKVEDIDAVLITHEHSDHVAALPMLHKYYSTPVYCTCGTAAALLRHTPCLRSSIITFCSGEEFNIGQIAVKTFKTDHDTPDSAGYRFTCGESCAALATDLGHISEDVYLGIYGAQTVVLESNHDVDMLRSGPYPPHLKKRILSKNGHLSNDLCAKMCVRLAQGGANRIILAHLSRENNSPSLALGTATAALMEAGENVGTDVFLHAAPPDDLCGPFEL